MCSVFNASDYYCFARTKYRATVTCCMTSFCRETRDATSPLRPSVSRVVIHFCRIFRTLFTGCVCPGYIHIMCFYEKPVREARPGPSPVSAQKRERESGPQFKLQSKRRTDSYMSYKREREGCVTKTMSGFFAISTHPQAKLPLLEVYQLEVYQAVGYLDEKIANRIIAESPRLFS